MIVDKSICMFGKIRFFEIFSAYGTFSFVPAVFDVASIAIFVVIGVAVIFAVVVAIVFAVVVAVGPVVVTVVVVVVGFLVVVLDIVVVDFARVVFCGGTHVIFYVVCWVDICCRARIVGCSGHFAIEEDVWNELVVANALKLCGHR